MQQVKSHIAIIGMGFSGLTLAIQLIQQANQAFQLTVINPADTMGTGLAYQPHMSEQLLNVPTGRMGLFADKPDDFLQWILAERCYADMPEHELAALFLPRALYGQYLNARWQQYLQCAKEKNITVIQLTGEVTFCQKVAGGYQLTLADEQTVSAQQLVLANGNHLPSNAVLPDAEFCVDSRYIRNPWQNNVLQQVDLTLPVLIIGNGLTMADTVLQLKALGLQQPIYALSRHGYEMLPHQPAMQRYADFSAELAPLNSLRQVVRVVRQHIKKAQQMALPPDAVIDSLRGQTQELWQGFSLQDKKRFLTRWRHRWGAIRHRLPMPIYKQLQELKASAMLHVLAAKLLHVKAEQASVAVHYQVKGSSEVRHLQVGAVINCTGPETNIQHLSGFFMQKMLQDGLICQEPLRLGLQIDPTTLRLYNSAGETTPNLYTLGANLRGILWESTAVHELRQQAAQLAKTALQVLPQV